MNIEFVLFCSPLMFSLCIQISSDRNSTKHVQKFCGSVHKIPGKVTSASGMIYVHFFSDMSYAGRGFSASYRSVAASMLKHSFNPNIVLELMKMRFCVLIECGGIFSLPNGQISSPNYPKNYEADTTCEWLLLTEPAHSMTLKFMDFDIERSENCIHDSVKIYSGRAQHEDKLIQTLCGNEINTTSLIKSSTNEMLVVMQTDSSFEAKGFLAKYEPVSWSSQQPSLTHLIIYFIYIARPVAPKSLHRAQELSRSVTIYVGLWKIVNGPSQLKIRVSWFLA